MTVDELIQLLAKHSPSLRVVVNGYEYGYDYLAPEQLSVVRIALNTGEQPWEGQHEDANGQSGVGTDGAEVVEVLFLRRVSN